MDLGRDCPTHSDLEAFALGKLLPADASRMEIHLDRCPSCRAAFQSLSSLTLTTPAPHLPGDSVPASAGDQFSKIQQDFAFLLPPIQDDEIGRLGSYRVLRLLGQGGMGMVFLAEDISLARPVALKVMRPELKADRDGWQRFLREARTMASIKHDHLVTIYQAGQERDVVYFAMELLEGESLESWMQKITRPDIAEVIRIGKQIAAGLAFIHQKNLIHRDIKPANIWLEGPQRRVKILDLGLVRPLTDDTSLTRSGMILGTPDYMSPEQARSDPVDARTDLFSLGCVLYCLCTGRKPFQGPSFTAVLMALASDTPPMANQLNPQVHAPLSDLIMELLARNPNKRPPSAQAVLDRLTAIEAERDDPQLHVQPVKPARRGKPSARKQSDDDTEVVRKPGRARPVPAEGDGRLKAGLIVGVLVGAVVLGIVGAGIIWFIQRSRAPVPAPVAGPVQPGGADKMHLTEMKEFAAEHWPFRMGPDPVGDKEFKKKGPKGGGPIKEVDPTVRIQGKVMPRGIFMHPPAPPFEGDPASLTYRLQKQYQTFEAVVSMNDGPKGSEAPCTFWVYGDDKILWKSNPVSSQADAQKCVVSVKNVDQLKIGVSCAGRVGGAHAVWIDPFVSK